MTTPDQTQLPLDSADADDRRYDTDRGVADTPEQHRDPPPAQHRSTKAEAITSATPHNYGASKIPLESAQRRPRR